MKINTKTITWSGILIAIEIVLQMIGNHIAIGGIAINLSLLPVTIGAIVGGPIVGLFLGFVNGICVLFSPFTMSVFFASAPIGTIITCLTKCSCAGFLSGLLSRIFKKKSLLSLGVSSAIVPVINSFLFACFSLIFFKDFLFDGSTSQNVSQITYLIVFVIGWNFIFEFLSNVLLVPTICSILNKNKLIEDN